jgi:alpha-glucosidase (family GH31 glycosyl hydrolase)
MMNMNMFGFTHSGADACGAIDYNAHPNQTMDEELCLRWIQLATFFPLARHSQDFNRNDTYVSGPLGFKDEANKKQV